MFQCPICEEIIFTTKLCKDCERIRQLTKIYSRDKVIEVLNKVLVVRQFVPAKTENKKETDVEQVD
tara:strand:- start:69 stop:266 length:198 start_codon:yes stop_codon:yes gene_type:complete